MPFTDALREDPVPNGVRAGLAVARDDGVAVLTLARPEVHNAIDLALWRRLGSTVRDLGNDRSVTAVVVRGAGGRAFSAGADIAEFPRVRCGVEEARSYNRELSTTLRAVMEAPVPVIAMVDGLTIGGGCELVAACDVRIASDVSRFGVPVGQLGVILGLTETKALMRHIGSHNLKYLLFSGVLWDAETACRRGLVDRVVPSGELAAAVSELLDAVLASSRTTMRAAKVVTDMADRTLTPEDVDVLARLEEEAYGGEDLREGVAAFLAGRRPRFSQ